MELVKDNLFVFFFDLFFCFVIIIISILLPGSGPVHTSRQLDVKIVKAVQLGRNADHHSDDKQKRLKWVFRWNIWAVSWAVCSFRGKLERARPQSADLIQIWAIIAQVDEPSQRKQTRTGSGAQFAWEEAFSMWVSSSLFATFWAVISPSDFNKCFTLMEHISEKSQFTVQNFSSRFGTRWEQQWLYLNFSISPESFVWSVEVPNAHFQFISVSGPKNWQIWCFHGPWHW